MADYIFLSYSRRETLFVADLYQKLGNYNLQCWLDYRNLVPGSPWREQIDAGIADAAVVLVVVSKDSMESPNVGHEYEYALKMKKRVILAVFQAEPLPKALKGLEWVDFRGNFGRGVKQLVKMISQPPDPPEVFPRPGFSMPPGVWAIFVASLVTAVLSIPALFTGVIPYYLMRLPMQILHRRYEYFKVGVSVIILPIVLFLAIVFFGPQLAIPFAITWVISLMWVPFFFILLQTKTLRRWVQPSAARPSGIPRMRVDTPSPASLRFGVDHAPQDSRYVNDFISQMQKEGHKCVPNDQPMDAAFVFISTYKRDTVYDTEHQVVYPIILQDVVDLPRPLQRLQWMDYRRGLRNVPALARLLHDPRRLLDVLGSVPLGNQAVTPYMVQMILFVLALVGMFTVAGWLPAVLFVGRQLAEHAQLSLFLLFHVPVLAATLAMVYFSSRALQNRRGWLASWPGLVLTFVVLLLTAWLGYTGVGFLAELVGPTMHAGGIGPVLGPITFALGAVVIFVMLPFLWRDLHRWMPAKA